MKKLLALVLAFSLSAAYGQSISPPASGGGVSSVATGCGATGGPITSTGTISAAMTARTNSTTTDAVISSDCGNVIYENNAASIAVSMAQAGTTGFAAGTFFEVCNINAGIATITPTTSTIGGASNKAIPAGTAAQPSCVGFQSDGTNYNLVQVPSPAAPAGANPSATAGPTANNGSAGTFMRSDASPAVQKGSNSQFGIVEADGSTINCPSGVCTGASTTFGGQTVAPGASATMQGNGTKIQASSGATTTNDCVKFDANGNTVDAGAACGSGGGGASSIVSNYVTGGTLYSAPFYGMQTAAGAAYTANTTAYCSFGTVTANVTIKALTMRVVTGVASSNVEFAIYALNSPPTNTLTLIDVSSAQASSATSATNPQTNLANTTDTLNAGTLYAFCAASSGAIIATSFAASSTGAAVMLGSSTATNVLSSSSPVVGKSFAVTYSSTPSSTFPGTLTLSSGTDITGGAPQAPNMAFLVN